MTHLNRAVNPLVQLQEELEYLFSKNQLIPRLRQTFAECEEFDFKEYITSKEIPEDFGIDLLVQMTLHKRANLQTLVGCLRHHFEDHEDSCQKTTDMLLKAAEADLVDYSSGLKVFIVTFDITKELQEELDRFQFPLPMVVEPREITHNAMTGYLTTKGSVILRNNHHDDDVVLEHLNRMNSIPLTINMDTVKMVRNRWRNLDKPKQGETIDEFQKRKKAFEKYDRTSREVIDLLMSQSEKVYLTHGYDKRGRIYSRGYHCNYQGNAWCKAVVEFSQKEHVE